MKFNYKFHLFTSRMYCYILGLKRFTSLTLYKNPIYKLCDFEHWVYERVWKLWFIIKKTTTPPKEVKCNTRYTLHSVYQQKNILECSNTKDALYCEWGCWIETVNSSIMLRRNILRSTSLGVAEHFCSDIWYSLEASENSLIPWRFDRVGF